LRSRSHMDLGHLAEDQSNDAQSETLFSWFRLFAEDVLQALGDIENRSRIRADEFLVRSLVAEFISEQNRKGLTVPTDTAIEMYLQYWTHRPCSLRVQESLMKLTHHRNTRRKFGQVIRAEWMLQFSVIKSARDLDGFNFVVRFFEVHFFLLGRVRDRGDFEGLDRPSSFSLLLDLPSVSPHPRSGASQRKNICIYTSGSSIWSAHLRCGVPHRIVWL
jgi:hypothetical protein